jgi:phosphoribosylformylglycinamidine synthase
MHFADLARALTAEEQRVLAQLLDYGPRGTAPERSGAGECVLVVPRPGTISPW